MKAGQLRHRMRIERPVIGADGYRGVTTTWQTVIEVDAAIDALSGREFMGADRELAGLQWRITLRETPGQQIEPNWRGVDVDSGAVYDFAAILPTHKREQLTVVASSGASQP